MATNWERGPIRIAYPIGSLQIGGAELRALSLAERLPRSRFEVEFLSLTGRGALDQRAAVAGLRVRYVGGASLHASPLPKRVIGRVGKWIVTGVSCGKPATTSSTHGSIPRTCSSRSGAT